MIRTLTRGEQIPSHEPNRYVRSDGYVLLRWRIGCRSYVETYEHRVVGGRVTTEDHVHHVNSNRADNRPENLRPLSAEEHIALHHKGRVNRPSGRPAHNRGVVIIKSWHREAAALYESGLSTYEVSKYLRRNPASVYRALLNLDVVLRKDARVAIPHRERQSG